MTHIFPPSPPVGSPMSASRPSADARNLLALRRSANKHHIAGPGPDALQLNELLQIAMRVPDHRKLTPWRFIIFEDDARREFGKAVAEIYDCNHPEAESREILEASGLLLRAPVVVCVVSSPVDDGKTPIWEQELSAGAVCQNLLLAANAAGWAGVWLTEWIAFDEAVNSLLGLTGRERVAGYIYLGTATMPPPERARAPVLEKATRWKG